MDATPRTLQIIDELCARRRPSRRRMPACARAWSRRRPSRPTSRASSSGSNGAIAADGMDKKAAAAHDRRQRRGPSHLMAAFELTGRCRSAASRSSRSATGGATPSRSPRVRAPSHQHRGRRERGGLTQTIDTASAWSQRCLPPTQRWRTVAARRRQCRAGFPGRQAARTGRAA